MGEVEMETWRRLPHDSFDAVFMNPPFTRATGHEGKKSGCPYPCSPLSIPAMKNKK
jgi:hypothetical protein